MRRIAMLLCLVCVLGGCRAVRCDALLIVDSLMINEPDKAYVMLKSIDPSLLSVPSDKALYALLYTQCQYKNFENITSDSLINIAVDYYAAAPKGSVRTISLMYKAIVMSEIGLYQEALNWHKQAELACDSTDYITLGLINTRMGELYQKIYIENNEHINKYKRALRYFKHSGDSSYITALYRIIGHAYLTECRDSTYAYLDQADLIANDTLQELYTNHTRIYAFYKDEKYALAKNLALHVLDQCNEVRDCQQMCDNLARSYANLGQLDSAQYYFNRITPPTNAKKRMGYYMTLTEIEKCRGDYKAALKYNEISSQLADSIINTARRADLYRVEKRYDQEVAESKNRELKTGNVLRTYIIIICVLAIIILIVISYNIIRGKSALNTQKLALIERLQKESQQSNNELMNRLDSESKLKQALENQIKAIKQLVELSYRSGDNAAAFMDKFKQSVLINKFSDGVWQNLNYVVNEQNNGIVEHLRALHPQLTTEEMNFLSLMCCNFSYIEITVCMGYLNERSTCNKRLKIAKKIGISIPLDDYVRQRMSSLNDV